MPSFRSQFEFQSCLQVMWWSVTWKHIWVLSNLFKGGPAGLARVWLSCEYLEPVQWVLSLWGLYKQMTYFTQKGDKPPDLLFQPCLYSCIFLAHLTTNGKTLISVITLYGVLVIMAYSLGLAENYIHQSAPTHIEEWPKWLLPNST